MGERSELFVPRNVEELFINNGNENLYDAQLQLEPKDEALSDKTIQEIVTLIHRYKNGVKQELR